VSGSIDIDRYFARIGFTGEARPDLPTLRALHRLHPEAIPFENLDPLLGRRVNLELSAIQRKLVADERGGYCFEHNGLFQAVLREIGFEVTPLAARVVWSAPSALPARTHCLSLLTIDGERYIADVGFGGVTPTAPLRLVSNVEQETPHERMRLVQAEGDYVLEVLTEGAWRAMYRFTLEPQQPSDYAMANWWVSTHPESHFVNRLGVAIVASERRYALRDAELAIHDAQSGTARIRVPSAAELKALLAERFRIRLPDDPALARILERIVQA
jgi:N-hydroxyarylamine O-acetyltransferase